MLEVSITRIKVTKNLEIRHDIVISKQIWGDSFKERDIILSHCNYNRDLIILRSGNENINYPDE